VLAARGLSASKAQRTRVLGCGDVPTLARWLRQAVAAASVEEALD
jgi:hypothetical protein